MKIVNAAERFPPIMLPTSEQRSARDVVLDGLGEALFITEELCAYVTFDAPENESIQWAHDELRQLYTNIDQLMRRLSH